MPTEQRIAKAGETVSINGKVLTTFAKKPFEIGINGRNIRWTVGTPPKQTDWTVEAMTVTDGTPEADLWVNDGTGGKIWGRLKPGDENRVYMPGRDLQITVAVKPKPTPTPPPQIEVKTSPFPLVKPGEDIEKAMLDKGSVSLVPGAVYRLTDTIDFPTGGLTLESAGAGPLPILEMPFGVTGVRAQGKRDCILRNVEVRSTNNQNSNPAVRGYDSPGLRVLGCWLHGFRQGVSVECEHAPGELFVWDSWIRDNANVGGHGVGIYCDWVRYDVRRCHLDTNGWRPGQTSRDPYSHNFYGQGTCLDGGVFEDVLSNDASSHGAQLRAGGSFKRCVFLNCPIGFSYGIVNASKIHNGGVQGGIADVWVVGCPAIAPDHKPGWAGHFGNCLDVTADGLYACDDDLGVNPAFLVEACHDDKGRPMALSRDYVGVKRLVLADVAGRWAKGLYSGKDGLNATSVTYANPAQTPSLRAVLGADFLSNVRGKPSTAAATALAKVHEAWGVN